ncbi:MAG: EAL domain-containing protein [Zoogloeaceae bacterium]|nr:EAL domain-containing protein [Zoogloeaceae bacterium]
MADTGKGGISSPAADSSDIDTAFSKGLLNALLQADTGLLIMSIDMQHIIRHCNELAMRMLAPSIGQVIGRSVVDIHEQLGVDNKRFFAGLKKAQAQGEYRFEQKIEAEDGTHHLESRIIPLTETNGETTGYLFVSSDLKALKQAERMQRLLGKAVDQSPVAVIITDTLGITQYVNERFTLNTGYTADDVIGKRAGYQRSGQTPTEVYDGLWQTISAGREWRGELLNRRKSGELYWDAVRIVPLANTAGKITHYLSIQEDISQRKKDEETIRLWATVFENSGEAVVITDRDNRIVSVNQAFTDITGYAPGEVIGQNPAKFSSGRHDPDFFKEMWRRLNSYGHWQGEIWDRRKSGEVYPKWLGISAVRDGNDCVTHYVAIFSDISERKEAQERIEYLARHDPLTGLPNRMLLTDRAEQALASADRARSKLALLFLDLDRFKTINDSLGHAVGDALLMEVTARLQASVRETDTISRLGGDEFVVVVTDLHDDETVVHVARKILDVTQQPFEIAGHRFSISVSIGITMFPADGRDFDTLLKKADTAMYHAKDAGRSTYRFFTEQMNVNALERLLIQNRLQNAIDKTEFVLHYQPQIALGTGRIIGIESLVRWQNPELGLVPPDRFIPIAEENGTIIAIGDWVLYEACRQAKAWTEAGIGPLPMSVNISMLQLQQGDFVERVLAVLDKTGHDPSLLELEFTESVLIQDIDRVLEQVQRLKAAGISIAIDDFGTGYSSLSYLKRLDVDRLKIDRSFVRDIGTDPDDAAIVRAITQMARSLRLKVLAEGAETSEQTRFLLAEGCDEVQGFVYSRPLTADGFFRLYKESGGLLNRLLSRPNQAPD